MTNCQVRGSHLESAAWGWSHGEGSSRNSTPRPDTAWPCFSLEISALPHPEEWPSATSGSLHCPGRLRPESRSACRDTSSHRLPQEAPPRLALSPFPCCAVLLPLAVSRWLAQSPGQGRMLLPTAQGETEAQRRLHSLGSRPRPPDLPHHTSLPCEVPRALTKDRGRGFCWIPGDSEALAARRVWGLLEIGVGGAGGPPRKV